MKDISTLPNMAAATANLDRGEMVDDTTPGAGDGVPVRKDWMQDIYYALRAVLNAAGLTPDDSEEGVVTSQFLDALNTITGVPIGSVVAWLPGYFADGSNGTYTAVSISLPAWWKECDGSVLLDADSPIFNAAGRYLPNLTDNRFLMGDIAASAGGIGGENSPTLSHTVSQQPAFTYPDHYHQIADVVETTGFTLRFYNNAGVYSGGIYSVDNSVATGSADHETLFTGMSDGEIFYSKTDGGGACTRTNDVAISDHSSIENRPLYLSCRYVMRIK